MNAGICLLRRGGLAAALVVLTVGGSAGAAPTAPSVVLNGSTSTVAYELAVPPSAPQGDTISDGGRQASPLLGAQVTNDDGAASARSRQTTIVRHGPTAAGYTVRSIRSVANLTGTAELRNPTGEDVTTMASARSLTRFTVNAPTPYAFNNRRSVSTPDTAKDCARASVVLKRGETIVYRRALHVPGAGCGATPENQGDDGGKLTPGAYTLETLVEGETAGRKEYGVGYVAEVHGTLTAALTLGTGRICRNVVPGAAGATIVGTARNDVLCGGTGPDEIKGLAGNDMILGQSGPDRLVGGQGSDRMAGAAGADAIYGSTGNDVITPGGARDTVYAGDGDDTVRACDDVKDRLFGQVGTDKVFRDAVDGISRFEIRTLC